MSAKSATPRNKARSSQTGRKPGGQSRLTTDNKHVNMLLKCIGAGVPITHACKAAGIPYRTYRDWYNLGEKGDPEYVDFYNKAVEADGQFVARCVAQIMTASRREWTAAAWMLERRFPKDFGRRQEISGPDGGPIQITETGKERLRKLLQDMHDKKYGIENARLIGSGSTSENRE